MDKRFVPQGATISDSGVRYRVWAPQLKEIAVEILSGPGAVERTVALSGESHGFFEGVDTKGGAGDLYKFRLNRTRSLPDPASRWQPEGVHGPSMVIDPNRYPWRDERWRRPDFRDFVIYELHVGTFSPRGDFRSAIDYLQHIRDLGANAIELMPVADFAGGRNWGYDGVYPFAPSRAYGHPDDLRALVDAAHGVGLAVILDVVYNHFGPDGNYLSAYIGDYLEETTKTPWGGAIRYADPNFKPLRDWIISNPAYWMRQFHIDGFRLDATHAIFDDSSRHILAEITTSIHALGGIAIAEDPRNDVHLIRAVAEGGYGFDAVWADDFHHVVRVANTRENEGYFGDFEGSITEAVDVLRNGWLYRGDYSKHGNENRGTECLREPPQEFVHCISNHDQTGNHAFGERLSHRIHPNALRASAALICLSPYTPLLFMGQEWAASTPFLFFTDHNPEIGKLIVAGRKEEFKHFAAFGDPDVLEKLPNPQKVGSFEASKLAWEECHRGKHACAMELYKVCLALRAVDPAFRPKSRDAWVVEELAIGIGALRLHSVTADWLVVFDLTGDHEGSLRDETIFETSVDDWKMILSSNEIRFGGSGSSALDLTSRHATFTTAETIVLKACRR